MDQNKRLTPVYYGLTLVPRLAILGSEVREACQSCSWLTGDKIRVRNEPCRACELLRGLHFTLCSSHRRCPPRTLSCLLSSTFLEHPPSLLLPVSLHPPLTSFIAYVSYFHSSLCKPLLCDLYLTVPCAGLYLHLPDLHGYGSRSLTLAWHLPHRRSL